MSISAAILDSDYDQGLGNNVSKQIIWLMNVCRAGVFLYSKRSRKSGGEQ